MFQNKLNTETINMKMRAMLQSWISFICTLSNHFFVKIIAFICHHPIICQIYLIKQVRASFFFVFLFTEKLQDSINLTLFSELFSIVLYEIGHKDLIHLGSSWSTLITLYTSAQMKFSNILWNSKVTWKWRIISIQSISNLK